MCCWRGKRNWDERIPHQNWLTVMGMIMVHNIAYSIPTPSIYQFITTPHSIPKELENEEDSSRFWPGLDGSETQYAWALTAYAIGETFFSPVAGFTTERYPYIFTLFTSCALFFAGGMLYGSAVETWMVIVARFFFGCASGMAAVVTLTYTGEMSTRMDEIRERKGKKPRKFVLYIIYSLEVTGSYVISFSTTSIMGLFDGLNPYRWPGWFIAATIVLYTAITLIIFKEIRPPPKLKRPKGCVSCHCVTGLKLSTQLQSNWKMQFTIYTYLIICSYVFGQFYSVISTLITPVLSDQFGFTVEYTSHYLIGVAVALFMGSVIQLLFKVCKVNNRKVLGVALLFGLVGSVLVGDWQAIAGDPCSASDIPPFNTSTNTTNSSEMIGVNMNMDQVLNSRLTTDELNSTSNLSLYRQLVEDCDALSSSSHQCYWNPESHITGEFCNTCLPTCLSKQTTIDFSQYTVGILLISFAIPLGYVLTFAVASDIASVDSQGIVMGLTVGAGASARAISPYWFVASYELSGRHTYISSTVMALFCLLMLLGLVVLYKKLAPRNTLQSTPRKHESTNHVVADDPIADDPIADDLGDMKKDDPESVLESLSTAGTVCFHGSIL